VTVPPTVPAAGKVCTPTLRPRAGKVRVDLPWQIPHTPPVLAGHTRALGVDWGLNTPLTATVADLDPHGNVTAHGRAAVAVRRDRGVGETGSAAPPPRTTQNQD
jgi:hypothetical protein